MTTSQGDHARVLRIIQEEVGASDEEARGVLARIHASGMHIVSVDPLPDPNTGDKAKPRQTLLDQTRAQIAEAQEAARRAELEHTATAGGQA